MDEHQTDLALFVHGPFAPHCLQEGPCSWSRDFDFIHHMRSRLHLYVLTSGFTNKARDSLGVGRPVVPNTRWVNNNTLF